MEEKDLDILERIHAAYYQLTATERKVADYVLAQHDQVQFMSITQLADECGVSMETIRNVLIGHTKPHQGTIEAILKKTGLSYEEAFRK